MTAQKDMRKLELYAAVSVYKTFKKYFMPIKISKTSQNKVVVRVRSAWFMVTLKEMDE